MRETQDEIFKIFPELKDVEIREKDNKREVRSYMLRSGYLHTCDVDAVKEYYPHYGVEFKEGKIDPRTLFDNDKPVIVEIGFGMGDSTYRIAQERDQYNYLCLEVFITGFCRLLRRVGELELENVRLMRFDAVQTLESMIADHSVAGFHIFFPDPWMKKRHFKRRLIQKPFATLLESKLEKDGYIYAVTDWPEYADQMLEVFDSVEGLKNPYDGFAPSRSWRPMTVFERKGLKAERPIREVWVTRS